jgi:dynein heavy chain
MCRIFSTILDFKFISEAYPSDICAMARKLVLGTLDIYRMAEEELLPTPAKVHYTFNLRDFSKVIIGILMLGKAESDTQERHTRLWAHEVFRVFGDRLVTDEDRKWMLEKVRLVTKKQFSLDFDKIFGHLDRDNDKKVSTIDEIRGLFFTDLMGVAQVPHRPYREVQSTEELQHALEEHLQQYNMMSPTRMNLVLFLYAVEHLSRVARTLRFPGGNSLCVGVGGSGRQSCAKLAAFLADFKTFQIEIAKGY